VHELDREVDHGRSRDPTGVPALELPRRLARLVVEDQVTDAGPGLDGERTSRNVDAEAAAGGLLDLFHDGLVEGKAREHVEVAPVDDEDWNALARREGQRGGGGHARYLERFLEDPALQHRPLQAGEEGEVVLGLAREDSDRSGGTAIGVDGDAFPVEA